MFNIQCSTWLMASTQLIAHNDPCVYIRDIHNAQEVAVYKPVLWTLNPVPTPSATFIKSYQGNRKRDTYTMCSCLSKMWGCPRMETHLLILNKDNLKLHDEQARTGQRGENGASLL